jgi:hypothetical protein
MPNVSECKTGNYEYFRALVSEMESCGPSALLDYLQQRKFSKDASTQRAQNSWVARAKAAVAGFKRPVVQMKFWRLVELAGPDPLTYQPMTFLDDW